MPDKTTHDESVDKAHSETATFNADEKQADKAWEKEKDIVSGVDKTIEKKLDEGDLWPGDIENLGD
jgi:hypothetical protein